MYNFWGKNLNQLIVFEIPTGPVCTDWYFTNPASNWHVDRTNLSGSFKTTPTIQFRSRIMVTAWLSTIEASLRGGNLLVHWIQQRPIKGLLGPLDALSPYFLPSRISLHSLSHPTQISLKSSSKLTEMLTQT